jgi:O-antigen/teichoic acid export membrane protein
MLKTLEPNAVIKTSPSKADEDIRFLKDTMVVDYGLSALFGLFQGVAGFLSGIAVARMLGTSGRGSLAAIQQWCAFLSTVSLFGVQDSLLYRISKDRQRAGSLWFSAISLTLVTSGVFAFVGYLLLPRLLGSEGGDVVRLARQLLLMVSFYYPFQMMSLMVMRGRHNLVNWNFFRISSNLAWLLVVGCGVLLQKVTLPFYIWGQGLLNIVLIVPFCLIPFKTVREDFSWDFSSWGKFLRFGGPIFLSTVPFMLVGSGRLAVFYLGSVDHHAAGLFAVAIGWGNIGIIFYQGMSNVIFPRVAEGLDRVAQREIFSLCVRNTVAVVFPLGFFLCLLTPWLFPRLYGPNFSSAMAPAVLLAGASAVSAVRSVMREGLKGLGRPRDVLTLDVFSVIVFAGGLFFLPIEDLVWRSAVAWSLEEFLVTLIFLFGLKRKEEMSIFGTLVPKRAELRATWEKVAQIIANRFPFVRRVFGTP